MDNKNKVLTDVNIEDDKELQLKNTLVMTMIRKMSSEGVELNVHTVTKYLKSVMELVELTDVKGKSQKTLAIKVMRELVNNTDLDGGNKQILFTMLDNNVIDDMIELVVDVTRGNVDINKVVDAAKCCFGFVTSLK
tara:strand:+ start:7696 stop:8103 length:408 start_codon:yes stop_codon:yes gene_type:complete